MNKDWRLEGLTEAQKEVVLAKLDSDILVSASAGSGKTRVLSERIAYRISEHSIDLNRILILTFTEAASMSMKKRIEDKINQSLSDYKNRLLALNNDESNNKTEISQIIAYINNLKEASDNLSICNISTFHSFCKSLIDQNLSKLNELINNDIKLKDKVKLRPSYTILDETRSDVLFTKACNKVLSKFYNAVYFNEGEKSSRESFFRLTQLLGSGKNDKSFISFIKQLHSNLRTYPNYLQFFESSIDELDLLVDKPSESIAFCLVYEQVKKIVEKFRLEIDTVCDVLENELAIYIRNKCYQGAEDRELCIFYALYIVKNIVDNLKNDYLSEEVSFDLYQYKEIFDKYTELAKHWQLASRLLKISSKLKDEEQIKVVEDIARRIIDFFQNGAEIVVDDKLIEDFSTFKTLRLAKSYPFVNFIEITFELDHLFYYLFGTASRSSSTKTYTLDFHPFKYDSKLIVNEVKSVLPLLRLLSKILVEVDLEYKKLESIENAVDFSDLIHYALKLIESDREFFSSLYDEVYIDEYQDTSAIQERLFDLLAHGKRFMVGDMKQSIYRFQGAKIDNFRNKERKVNDENIQIYHLNTNFRTDSNLLAFINCLFSIIMTRDLGEVNYDESQIMNPNINKKCAEKNFIDQSVKIINISTLNKSDLENEEFAKKYEYSITKNKLETKDLIKHETNMPYYFIAEYIDKIINDKDRTYKDIAILSRNNAELQKIANVLSLKNIPVSVDYEVEETYSEREVETLLRLIDNPYQDYVLVAFLLSDLNRYRFTHKELAQIRAEAKNQKIDNTNFYQIFQAYVDFSQNEKLKEKVQETIIWINKLLVASKFKDIYEIVLEIYNEIDYQKICSLREDAFEEWYFAKEFLRYVSSLKQTAEIVSIEIVQKLDSNTLLNIIKSDKEAENDAVRLLTYHKSKGLEFKEVILYMGQGKLNSSDKNGLVCIDENFGLSSYSLINNFGFKYKSYWRQLFHLYNLAYDFSEELRIIYVALTRAENSMHIIFKNNNLLKNLNDKLEFKYNDVISSLSTDKIIDEYLKIRNNPERYYAISKSISHKNKFVQSITDWLKILLVRSKIIGSDNLNVEAFTDLCRFIPEGAKLDLDNFNDIRNKIMNNNISSTEIIDWLNSDVNKNRNQLIWDARINVLYLNLYMDRDYIYSEYANFVKEDTSSIKIEILRKLRNIDLEIADDTYNNLNSSNQSSKPILSELLNQKLSFEDFVKVMKKSPIDSFNNLPSKYAASALSHLNTEYIQLPNRSDEEFDVEEYLENEEIVSLYPSIDEKILKLDDFLDNKESNDFSNLDFTPSQKGTIFHKCMRYLNFEIFKNCTDYADFSSRFEAEMDRIKGLSLLFDNEIEVLNSEYKNSIYNFFNCPIIKSILDKLNNKESSDLVQKVYKEKSFTMKTEGNKYINRGSAFSKFHYPIYIQGVIDFVYIDGDEATIIDYKTDRIDDRNITNVEAINEMFNIRYYRQLEIYKEALEKALDIMVTKKLIYSVALGNFIEFD